MMYQPDEIPNESAKAFSLENCVLDEVRQHHVCKVDDFELHIFFVPNTVPPKVEQYSLYRVDDEGEYVTVMVGGNTTSDELFAEMNSLYEDCKQYEQYKEKLSEREESEETEQPVTPFYLGDNEDYPWKGHHIEVSTYGFHLHLHRYISEEDYVKMTPKERQAYVGDLVRKHISENPNSVIHRMVLEYTKKEDL